jgi:hypothetical protein
MPLRFYKKQVFSAIFIGRLTSFHLIVLVYAFLSVVFIFTLDLTEQEAYYWLWAKNLDWSYFDHPPLQAWVTALLTLVLGNQKWVLRIPAFFGTMAVLVIFYKWTKHKWGQQTAELCSLLLMSNCVFMMGSVISLPDSLAVPLGLASAIFAHKGYIKRAAFLFGFALLAKWTVLFVALGVVYTIYRQNKFRLSQFFQFGLIVLMIQTPVIWWNIHHGNVTAKFHLYGRHVHTRLSPLQYAENSFNFFLAQFFSMGLLITALLIFVWTQRQSLKKFSREQWEALLFWSLPGLAIVFVSAIQGQIRFYWTFLSLIPAIAWLGYGVVEKFPNIIKKLRMGIVAMLIFQWGCGWVAGFYPIGSAVEMALNLKPDLRRSPMGEFNGWEQWYFNTLLPTGLLDEKTALLGSDFHVASRLSWTVRNERDLTSIGVVGLSKNQFQFWSQPLPPNYKKAIFFGDNRYDRLDNLEKICNHKSEWKTTPVKAFNLTIKNVYWAYCDSLREPN